MKNVIHTLLTQGYSRTAKYRVEDLPYFLRPLFEDDDAWGITAKHNRFWDDSNKEARRELTNAMLGYKEDDIREGTKFEVLNRIENGDAYGIELGKCFKISRNINGKIVEIELTPREQRLAFEKQQQSYNEDAVLNELVDCSEDYDITEEEAAPLVGKMARKMQVNIDKYDMHWDEALREAIQEVIEEYNKEKEDEDNE